MSSRRQRSIPLGGRYRQVALYIGISLMVLVPISPSENVVNPVPTKDLAQFLWYFTIRTNCHEVMSNELVESISFILLANLSKHVGC